jgi:hypothetical protein
LPAAGSLCYTGSISTIARKLKSDNTPLIVAVFLVVAGLLSGLWVSGKLGTTNERTLSSASSWVKTAQAETSLPAVLVVDNGIVSGALSASEATDSISLSDYRDGAIKDSGLPH